MSQLFENIQCGFWSHGPSQVIKKNPAKVAHSLDWLDTILNLTHKKQGGEGLIYSLYNATHCIKVLDHVIITTHSFQICS